MKKKRKRKIFFRLLTALLIFAAAFCMVRFRPYVVLSGSMEPALKVGGIVWTDLKKKDASVGEIITFQKDGRIVTHRVAGKTDGGYLTRGDANEEADPGFVAADEVIGTAAFYVPSLGFGVVWTQKYMFQLSGGVLVILLIVFFMPEKQKGKKKKMKDGKEQNL